MFRLAFQLSINSALYLPVIDTDTCTHTYTHTAAATSTVTFLAQAEYDRQFVWPVVQC